MEDIDPFSPKTQDANDAKKRRFNESDQQLQIVSSETKRNEFTNLCQKKIIRLNALKPSNDLALSGLIFIYLYLHIITIN